MWNSLISMFLRLEDKSVMDLVDYESLFYLMIQKVSIIRKSRDVSLSLHMLRLSHLS